MAALAEMAELAGLAELAEMAVPSPLESGGKLLVLLMVRSKLRAKFLSPKKLAADSSADWI